MGLLVLLVVPDRLEAELFQVEVGGEVLVEDREVVLGQGAELGTVVGLAHDLVLLNQVEAHQETVFRAHQGRHYVHHVLVLLLLRDRRPQEQDDRRQLLQLALLLLEQVFQHVFIQPLSRLDAHLSTLVLGQLALEVSQHPLREVAADVVEREFPGLKQLLDEQFGLLSVSAAEFYNVELLLAVRGEETVDDAVGLGGEDFFLGASDVVVFCSSHVGEQLVPLPAVEVTWHALLFLLHQHRHSFR